jgi:uridine kinase
MLEHEPARRLFISRSGAAAFPCEDREVTAFESVSTWKALPAPTPSDTRSSVLDEVASRVCAAGSARLRVVVDGLTGAGKTTFADELATAIRARGRSTLRASLDDFKHPWRHSREHGYDRETGEGYYRNPHDFASAQTLLLEPAGPSGSGKVVLCAHDPLTGVDHRAVTVHAPVDAVLIVDGVFGMRPEYDDHWDVRVWLHAEPDVALARGIRRDTDLEGYEEALSLHTTRFAVGERLYVDEVRPATKAGIVIDNTDVDHPIIERA